MNHAKFHIIYLLTACIAVGASAQPDQRVDTSTSLDRIVQFEKSIAQRGNVLKNSPKIKDSQRVDSLEVSIAECDSIIRLQKQMLVECADYDDLKNRLASLEIYEFLGRRDTTVFTDFKVFDINRIPLAHCNRTQYLLIEKIYLVNDALSKIEDKISEENIRKFANNNSVSTEDAKLFLYPSAEKDLINVDNRMNEIDGMDLANLLCPEHQQYYEQTLTNKYRRIYSEIYPE